MSTAGHEGRIDYRSLKLRVGIELHRQLNVGGKLFCSCMPVREEGPSHFTRLLRPSESELGEMDPAARFEAVKGFEIKYLYGESSSCLVEADEEPPHDVNEDALKAAISIARMLGSNVVDEVHVMRKMVIDGSNTTGFQRTMLIGIGGQLKVGDRTVGVQTVTLEEDAARIMGSEGRVKKYCLDRLGIPLIEVSLEPVEVHRSPQEVVEVAASLGRSLKSTGLVARGIGTVRQDLNISIEGSGIIEVKGVQELPLIAKIVDYEGKRLHWMRTVSEELKGRGISRERAVEGPIDVTDVLSKISKGFIRRVLSSSDVALAILARGYDGLLGDEPYPDVRIGRDLATIAKLFGLGGVIHSDELPGYGIEESMVGEIRARLGASDLDGFVIVVGNEAIASRVLEAIASKLREIVDGPPSETRAPTSDGKTRYLRPRPGAARMYPETDIPSMEITEEMMRRAEAIIPPTWDEQVKGLAGRYGLSRKLAEEILDSEMYTLFEDIISRYSVKPSVVAATLTEAITSIRREGLDVGKITEIHLKSLFEKISSDEIAKEAISDVLEAIAGDRAKTVDEAMDVLGLRTVSDDMLVDIIGEVLDANSTLIRERGEKAFGPLMGEVMSKVRGKVDGGKVSELLREALERRLAKT